MALVSILLAVLALVCTLIGFLTTPIPVLGLVFSFGAAGIALGGAMLGGKAISNAKQKDLPSDAARIAVVINVIAFVPALLVALTCGVCNAVFSTGGLHTQRNIDFGFSPRQPPNFASDAGPSAAPTPERAADGGTHAPGALPPPPLPAGPGK